MLLGIQSAVYLCKAVPQYLRVRIALITYCLGNVNDGLVPIIPVLSLENAQWPFQWWVTVPKSVCRTKHGNQTVTSVNP